MKKLKLILSACLIITSISSTTIVQASETNKQSQTKIESKAKLQNEWKSIKGKWYYFDINGIKKTGWLKDKGYWYYLNTDGVMHTGWLKLNNKWYYLNQHGVMLTGWQSINNKWYYLNSDGSMKISWLKDNNNLYYLDLNGSMAVGRRFINNKVYYFEGNGKLNTKVGECIVKETERHIGAPYVWQACGPYCFDCSGLTSYVFKKFGYDIGRTTYDQINVGIPVTYGNLQIGDLVFCLGTAWSPRHVGIYVGNGQMIHAPHTGESVKISPIYHFVSARRINIPLNSYVK